MPRRPRHSPHTILIVCEGSKTEPFYFNGLKHEAEASGIYPYGLEITIDPTPQEEDDTTITVPNPHKTRRQRRQLKPADSVLQGEIEPEYRAIPAQYVRKAQLGLEDGTFDDAYAVFDKDGHPAHALAFSIAENVIHGKKARIGFSSISFEQWVLLHFEFSIHPFAKSECKYEDGQYIGCGTEGAHTGCAGARCVAGYLRTNGHNYEKNDAALWELLRDRLLPAFRHAARLRYVQRHQLAAARPYEVNPYTDLDFVIGRILGLDQFEAVALGEVFERSGIQYSVMKDPEDVLRMAVVNRSSGTAIVRPEIFWTDHTGRCIDQRTERLVLTPGSEIGLLIARPDTTLLEEIELNIRLDNKYVYLITEA